MSALSSEGGDQKTEWGVPKSCTRPVLFIFSVFPVFPSPVVRQKSGKVARRKLVTLRGWLGGVVAWRGAAGPGGISRLVVVVGFTGLNPGSCAAERAALCCLVATGCVLMKFGLYL